jgi:hypothetical protein
MENENSVTVQRITLFASEGRDIVVVYVGPRNTISSPSTRSLFIARAEGAPKNTTADFAGLFMEIALERGSRDKVRILAEIPHS